MAQISLRPQPLGIFPPPVCYLVLPAAPGAEAAHASLLQGHLPATSPPEWRFYGLALAGKRDEALIALADDHSSLACYNRFVLSGSPSAYAARASIPPGDLALLFDVAAYSLGYREIPPDPAESKGELRAIIMMAWGSVAMGRGDLQAAEADVRVAFALACDHSPLLTAQLALVLAEMRSDQFENDPIALQYMREALTLLKGSGLREIYAQAALHLGTRFHEIARGQPAPLYEAAHYYQEALSVISGDSHPEYFTRAQYQMAMAYLAIASAPMGDQACLAAAAQALRASLTIYTREQYPERWQHASMCLAQVLQRLPDASPSDHLALDEIVKMRVINRDY